MIRQILKTCRPTTLKAEFCVTFQLEWPPADVEALTRENSSDKFIPIRRRL